MVLDLWMPRCQGWYYNVLLTGTLPSGTDAKQYQIKQNVVERGSATTESGNTISLNDKHQETIAPTGDTKYWAAKGNVIYGLDSPGLRNLDPKSNEFVRSATLTMHFESWVAKGNTRVSSIVKWDVKITVRDFQGKITGGLD
jgi:hypothetical protein